jgi:hypothetical protein
MKTIIVHTPQNEISWTYRYYNHFWKFFIEFLKTKFVVEEDTYFEFANRFQYEVQLLNDVSKSNMLECEMIIEDKETKEFVVLSVSDLLTGSVLNHQSNPLCKKILFSQFDRKEIYRHLRSEENKDKYNPWIYFPSNLYDIDSLYEYRKSQTELIDKFCFWGTSIEARSILSNFSNDYFDGGRPIGDFYNYSKKLLTYKVALSIAGRGEFCYRDIENFGMGIPIIRFEYKNELYNPLIPNYHYISIDRPDDLPIDREGKEHHAKMIESRFLEVKDDVEFLKFISENARKYYEDHLSVDGGIKTTYEILKLNEWE